MPRTLDSLTPAEILPAVLTEVTERNWAEWSDIAVKVAKRLDSSYENTGARHRWDAQKIQVRFEGRVKRALEKLAGDGRLVRKDNGGYRNAHLYFTPAAWQKRQEAQARAAEVANENQRRQDRIDERLDAIGFYRTPDGELSSADWERLLDMVEPALALARRAMDDYAKGDSTDV